MDDDNYPKATEAFYLPSDVKEWIDQQAKIENRSASNFLTTLIRRLRDGNSSHL